MTISCVLINHNYAYEVHTIAQLFFPNSRFSFNESNSDSVGQNLISRISGQACIGEVYINGSLASSYTVFPQGYVSEKRAVMLALYHALIHVIEAHTPWGALTGIRPSKLVRQWMNDGLSDEEIIHTLMDPFCCREEKARLAVTVAHAEKRLSEKIQGVGLYISIPFCPSRCLYCSFNTASKMNQADYVQALIKECNQKAMTTGNITSIYIGGGTPTVLSDELLSLILERVSNQFSISSDVEYTVEAGRPDSLTPDKLRILKSFGVNRIAVNPQTFNDRTLALIGRSHTEADTVRAFEMARAAGFSCINADIIAGLPGETRADMAHTLQLLMTLAPENITVHTLAVKRASKLNENLIEYENLSAVKEVGDMLDMAGEACVQAGFIPYYLYRQKNMVGLFENVGYARPGTECLYNVGMMAETQTIIGIGAAAVCKYVNGDKIERTFNAKNPEVYIKKMEENL